ncbi:hypothetical protein P0110_05190, partial [Chlamydia psittaci]|nr:hypothetical protein [Chlamydia psittaci]
IPPQPASPPPTRSPTATKHILYQRAPHYTPAQQPPPPAPVNLPAATPIPTGTTQPRPQPITPPPAAPTPPPQTTTETPQLPQQEVSTLPPGLPSLSKIIGGIQRSGALPPGCTLYTSHAPDHRQAAPTT